MQSSIFSLLLLGVYLGLDAMPGLSESALVRGTCPMSWFIFNGRCYKYVATHSTWADAEINCVSQGANLVSIYSLEEDNFVRSLIQNFDRTVGPAWIGLSDHHKDGAWMWSDGCPVVYMNWNKGEPNNYGGNEACGEIGWDNGKNWNDMVCSRTFPSVCATRKPYC
ncbi:ladderlectin-like [Boleophthalmus pectinirostris]|uniref:ladderlectin-like n=1 Tax=Boleophthalmus pectinirostris TaxID=150288 RepID=UPI000A1C4C61|nr:ladderlectin-like [Boleophthalmus pectinirostris]